MKEYPSKEFLSSIFIYHDGYLKWKIKHSRKTIIGQIAGSVNIHGRRTIKINKQLYYCSKLIFILHHGYMPTIVDHIDRNSLNDKIENLRASDFSKNQMNRSKIKECASRYKGVTVRTNSLGIKKYYANLKHNKKNNRLGSFDTEKEAAIAYNNKAKELFGEYAALNNV